MWGSPPVQIRGAASSRAKAHRPSLGLSSGCRWAEASLSAQDTFWKTPEPLPWWPSVLDEPSGTQVVFRGVGRVLILQDLAPPIQGLRLPQLYERNSAA